ncbi:PAS domain-containing protein [Candidatus Saccharibacteria bacterium]|nr:PAS domain-containing protein [Candidatus Saccharibacteria bacterium]
MKLFREKFAKMSKEAPDSQAVLAETVLNYINDGVIIIDHTGIVKLINPAALRMAGYTNAEDAVGLSYLSVMKLENGEGVSIPDSQNPLAQAAANNKSYTSRDYCLVSAQGKKIPISVSLTPSGEKNSDRIITFRNISEELKKEGEQTEFISTASHEMRTPVASIEGYLGLALNPSTATIDDRARQYLTEAHAASQHLGKLFRDLLDVTKLDDKREKLHLVPTEVISAVKEIADRQVVALNTKHLNYTFGSSQDVNGKLQIDQLAYAMIDPDFLQEIMNNLIENAIKYTEEGGSIWVNARNDGDNVLINVTDSGMGIAPDNLEHIFQKFYRVDNSATRTIGGTGLGLYIVKERVEAMRGRVWAESAFGEGSTFYVSFPRISQEEYDRQMMIIRNTQMMSIKPSNQVREAAANAAGTLFSVDQANPAPFAPTAAPIPTPTAPAPAAAPTASAAPTPVASSNPDVSGQSTGEDLASDLSADKLAELKRNFAAQMHGGPQIGSQ